MADVAQWYYFQGKQRVGPVSPQDVQDLLTGGDLPPDAMIRQNDERAEWNPAYSFGVFDIPEGRRLSPSQALGNGSVFQPYPAPAAMSDLWAAGEQSRPWVRYWAKMFDMNYFQVVWLAFLTFFAPGQTTVSIMDFMWAALAGFFPFLVFEAMFLSMFGTTPGKWVLNVRVRTSAGTKLTFMDAFGRGLWLWLLGFGLGIPLFTLIGHLMSYSRLKQQGTTGWDERGGFQVLHRPVSTLRTFGFIFLWLALPTAFVVSWAGFAVLKAIMMGAQG